MHAYFQKFVLYLEGVATVKFEPEFSVLYFLIIILPVTTL